MAEQDRTRHVVANEATAGADPAATPPLEVDAASPTAMLLLPPTSDTMRELSAVHQQSCGRVTDARSLMLHADAEGARLLPALAHSVAVHVKELTALRAVVAGVAQRAAACRARARALAEASGVDVEALNLHDPDAEIE
jgi:hypothetical protein